MNYALLEHIAYTLRRDCVRMTTHAGSGHPTSCLSAVELVVAYFFAVGVQDDHFILSKGHAAPLLYAVYAALGIIPHEELLQLRTFNCVLEGHPTARFPYAEAATGSLGQGLSIGLGMALHAQRQKLSSRVFVVLGDSELTEGSNWEAVHLAAYYKLHTIIALIDMNRLGQSTATIEGWDGEKIAQQYAAFGWDTYQVNGHNLEEIIAVMQKISHIKTNRPSAIIARTIKGYGLDNDIENTLGFHGKVISPEKLNESLLNLETHFRTATLYSVTEQDRQYIKARADLFRVPHIKHARVSGLPLLTVSSQAEATRTTYGKALAAYGELVPEIVSLDAEVKNSTGADIFEHKYPDRFVQCFIAEQNMIGMAAGFAQTGAIPFASTFAAFITRAHDQLRMAAIGNIPLRIVGSHTGVSIGQDGPSQMGLEDIALMRNLPGSVIFCPCDAVSTSAVVRLMIEYSDGISYMRTMRQETPLLYSPQHTFKRGGCHVLRSTERDCVCVIAAGITVFEALRAYDLLQAQGIFIRVIDAYCIKPLALELSEHIAACGGNYITVEDHYAAGGLGEAISALMSTHKYQGVLLAVNKLPRSGKPEELRSFEEIDSTAIMRAVHFFM